MSVKKIIKKIVPESIILSAHKIGSLGYAKKFGYPSKKMVMIGITGTKGKTTTANFIWSVLNAAGLKAGLIGTANIKIGDTERLNEYHMTMPGPKVLHGLLKEMVKNGCEYCVMEVTSEGIKQGRHLGIDFDIAIFTNLTPEHLPSHGGSFEKYKEAKSELFKCLTCCKAERKNFNGQKIPKIIIANNDSNEAKYFLSFKADKKMTFGIKNKADWQAKVIRENVEGVDFSVGDAEYHLNILGAFNVYNALPAIAVGEVLGIEREYIERGLRELKIIPGRMEKIEEGQDFTVIVDYAHEKESMTALMTTAKKMVKSENKIIVLLGAEGGGRDKAKRPAMGKICGEMADNVICSNVDPYEDEPLPIAEDIAKAAKAAGKKRNENLFVILDRREGIKKALSLAKTKDLVLITGKGAEQSMVIGGKKYEWDDRRVVREEIKSTQR